jgi:hypothetical protein
LTQKCNPSYKKEKRRSLLRDSIRELVDRIEMEKGEKGYRAA